MMARTVVAGGCVWGVLRVRGWFRALRVLGLRVGLAYLGLGAWAGDSLRMEILPETVCTPGLAGGAPYAMAASADGSRIAVARGAFGVALLTSNLTWTASVELPGDSRRVAWMGEYGLVLSPDTGMHLLDLGEAEHPRWVGTWGAGLGAVDAVVVERTAYVADRAGAIGVIDLTDPAHARELGGVRASEPRGERLRLALAEGGLLLAAGSSSGLTIFARRDAGVLERLGGILPGGGAVAVAVSGPYAYVAGGARNLVVVDLSDPAHPETVSVTRLNYPLTALAIHGDQAFVGTTLVGTYTVDIRNPASPAPMNGDQNAPSGAPVSDLGLSGGRLFEIYEGNGMVVSRLAGSGPRTFQHVWYGQAEVHDLAVAGDFASIVFNPPSPSDAEGPHERLLVVDLREPKRPEVVGGLPGSWGPLAMLGARIYALASPYNPGPGKMTVVDIGTPSRPREIATYPTASPAVEMTDGLLYLAHGSGLEILDPRGSDRPVRVGLLDLPGTAVGLAASGGRAVVLGRQPSGTSQLVMVDTSRPEQPTLAGVLGMATGIDWVAVAVDGELGCALYTDGRPSVARLATLDLGRAGFPSVLAVVPMPVNVRDVVLRQGIAYVATLLDSVHVVDVHDPKAPVTVHRVLGLKGLRWPGALNLAFRGPELLASGGCGLALMRWFSGRNVALRVSGGDPGGSWLLESADEVGPDAAWAPRVEWRAGGTAFDFTEPDPGGVPRAQRFYRVRPL